MKNKTKSTNNVSSYQLTNGQKIHIYFVDKEYNVYAKLIDEPGNISVFVPKTYLKIKTNQETILNSRKRIIDIKNT